MLFRGWSRLCLHVASHNAGVAVAAAIARTEEEAIEPTATNLLGGNAADTAAFRRRLEAAEKNARAHVRRADAMERRAAAATERVKELESAAGIPSTAGALLEQTEEAGRAVEQQERRQAVRLVSAQGC